MSPLNVPEPKAWMVPFSAVVVSLMMSFCESESARVCWGALMGLRPYIPEAM